jgi:hypothetical protein
MGAYAGARITGRAELVEAIRAAGERAAAPGFLTQARSRMPDAMLPFERDELDLAYAAAMTRSTRPALLRGLHTWVEAGCFLFTTASRDGIAVRYIDRSDGERLPSEVLLDPMRCARLIAGIGALPRVMATLRFTAVPNRGFEVALVPELSALNRPRGHATPRSTCTVSVVTRSRVVALGSLEFQLDGGLLAPVACPVERLMELHAAALDDAWLLIDHPALRVLGPIPDPGEEGRSVPARVEPIAALASSLGGSHHQGVPMPVSLARELAARFHWLASPNPIAWRLLIESAS